MHISSDTRQPDRQSINIPCSITLTNSETKRLPHVLSLAILSSWYQIYPLIRIVFGDSLQTLQKVTMAKQPETVSGGCLCGAVRYEISFDGEGSWPPEVSIAYSLMCFLAVHASFLVLFSVTDAISDRGGYPCS